MIFFSLPRNKKVTIKHKKRMKKFHGNIIKKVRKKGNIKMPKCFFFLIFRIGISVGKKKNWLKHTLLSPFDCCPKAVYLHIMCFIQNEILAKLSQTHMGEWMMEIKGAVINFFVALLFSPSSFFPHSFIPKTRTNSVFLIQSGHSDIVLTMTWRSFF